MDKYNVLNKLFIKNTIKNCNTMYLYVKIAINYKKNWGLDVSRFHVELKKVVDDSYDIEIGHNLGDKLIEDLKNGLVKGASKYAVITDSTVKDLYAEEIYNKMIKNGFNADLFVFPAGEKSKTRKTKEIIEDAMIEKSYRRDCAIIAIGGGVVTDLAGFIAGTYGRGVPFVNYASTHLAAADASIGGKTAVDTDMATNLIGLINQPQKVYIDIEAWKTLPRRQLISGLCETIKHACLADKEFFTYLENNIDKILQYDTEVCEHVAERNCSIKYNVVMQDENEKNMREILNLGHTVGRAIETVSNYKLLHGEAVAIGLVAEVNLAHSYGYVSEDDRKRVINLLDRVGLPTEIPDYINKEELVKKLYTDKKVRSGKLRFVLQDGIGNIKKFGEDVYAKQVPEEDIRTIIAAM